MKPNYLAISLCLLALLPSACAGATSSQTTVSQPPHLEITSQPAPPLETSPASSGLSPEAVASLRSLRQVDDYPLYTMQYVGEYVYNHQERQPVIQTDGAATSPATWGCSLFAALGEGSERLVGRNFDWEFSPSLLLFTYPPDGYASVSMVDIAYLGFAGDQAQGLTDLPLEHLLSLLDAPAWPFDGLNSQGLAIGMAAVPDGELPPDPHKPTLDSLMVMREVLDHAADVGQALEIFDRYNIEMGGGPPLHYLLADASGKAALVEFYNGQMRVIPNQAPYHLATNFLLSATGDKPAGQCWRYDAIQERLAANQGRLSSAAAIQLLSAVSQDNTQWSIVYNLTSLEVHVIAGRQYNQSHYFELK